MEVLSVCGNNASVFDAFCRVGEGASDQNCLYSRLLKLNLYP